VLALALSSLATGGGGRSASALAAQRTTQVACSAPNDKVSYPPAAHGLFLLGATGADARTYIMPSPLVCGIDIFVDWDAIDSGPGHNPQYNWTNLDAEIAPWEAAGKEVALIVSGASELGTADLKTPAYVASKVTMVTCPNEPPVPVFWQSIYLSNWEAFIKATVNHFRSDPHIAYIRFGVTVLGEGYIPGLTNSNKTCLDKWDAVGYQSDFYPYLTDLFKFEGSLGSVHRVFGSLNYDDMANGGAIAAAAGVGVGMEGMAKASADAVLTDQPCPWVNWCATYASFAKKTPLYVQMFSYSDPSGNLHQTPPSKQEVTGPLPPLLQAGIAIHTQIFEIYQQDWLLALDPSYPGYATYHTEYLNALTAAAAAVN